MNANELLKTIASETTSQRLSCGKTGRVYFAIDLRIKL